jgi:hypothetical protein
MAMTASGEALLVRTVSGETLLYQPTALGGVQAINSANVDRIIAMNDLLRIERDFDNWVQLDQFRTEKIRATMPEIPLDLEHMTTDDVRPLIDLAEQWNKDNETERALALANRLLDDVAAVSDDDLLQQRLRAIVSQQRTVVMPLTEPKTPVERRAREVWETLRGTG